MADQKISELTAKTTLADTDLVSIVDIEATPDETKKITGANLRTAMLSHTQGTDTALGAVETKNPPIDADKALYRDSEASDALKTSTWTQVKAFLKTYLDTLYRAATADHTHQSTGAQAGKLDHGLALDGLTDDDHTQYIKHSLATAASDFLAASGSGAFVKKTQAETKALVAPNQYIPGANDLNLFANDTGPSSTFTAKINAGGSGGLTTTNVPYDGDSGEGFLASITYTALAGKVLLWNTTRATARVITAIDTAKNNITTESSSDSWADNDDITIQSQVNTTSGYFDIDISSLVASTCVGVAFASQLLDTASGTYYAQWHPYETYAASKEVSLVTVAASKWTYIYYIVPVVSQRITMKIVASGASTFSSRVKYLGRIDSA